MSTKNASRYKLTVRYAWGLPLDESIFHAEDEAAAIKKASEKLGAYPHFHWYRLVNLGLKKQTTVIGPETSADFKTNEKDLFPETLSDTE
jgi:hypothetical protein